MKIGIDIQDVEPVKRFIGTNKMNRIFSKQEIAHIEIKAHAPETIAGIFCAKEAFFKAIGTGIQLNQLKEVQIHHTDKGAPYYNLSNEIISQNNLQNATVSLSISHTKTTAVAVCYIMDAQN